ncbi:hypothetical protein M378DRAFT_163860 [Amanita muscaria Koide BX008]|uniref:Uncharacterized protein n=1 Tax=Amanita muscaria (strain Koide BX008) TaxID=946122 RepID=A0A0C2WQH1_AMAMK|nr:hypothetical protein M378DRAFT_163860 [Amanita muscaria Koide BX008]
MTAISNLGKFSWTFCSCLPKHEQEREKVTLVKVGHFSPIIPTTTRTSYSCILCNNGRSLDESESLDQLQACRVKFFDACYTTTECITFIRACQRGSPTRTINARNANETTTRPTKIS